MKLGLCTIASKDAPVEDVLSVAAAAGYDGVEIWGRDHVGDRSSERLASIREAAANRNLDIPVYGSYLRPGTSNYEERAASELDAASELGASLIRVWAGDQEYEKFTQEHWNGVVEDLRDLSDRAADYGIDVTVERHAGTLTNARDGARLLIEAVDRENCRLNWQPRFDLPAEEILASARDLAPLSNNVHLQGAPEPGDPWPDQAPLDEAYFDVHAVLEAFEDAGFDGYVEVEFVTDDLDFETAAGRDREYLASVVEGEKLTAADR